MTGHNSGPRRALRPGTLAITALATSLTLLNPAMPVALADGNSTFGIEAQADVAQTVPSDTSALQWGIRGSFVRYVSGASHILDGAKQGPNNTYLWPYQSTTKQPDSDEVTIQYGGTVNFMKYCGGETKRPNCDLDFTFSAPKIVLNTKTGMGKLFATIHTKDYLTKQWSGPEERQIGNLDANAARYNISGGKMHFSGVAATLTSEGNAAFSNFYEEGSFLDALSFTLDDTFTLGERTGYNLSNQIHTDVEFENSNRVFARSNGSVLNVTAGSDGKIQLMDKELKRTLFVKDLAINASSPAAFDARTDRLYWIHNSTVKTAIVTDAGLTGEEELTTFGGKATGFTYSPSRDAVAVLHNEGDYANPKFKMTLVKANKEVQAVDLPAPSTVVPNSEDTTDLYGSVFGGEGTGLRALPDGTFISLYDFVIQFKDGSSESSVPLHIKPDATEPVTQIQEFTDFMRGSRGGFRGISVDGQGNIGIYSVFASVDNKSKSTIGFARYNNGAFTVYPAAAHPDAQGVAGLTFTNEGNAVFVSQDRSVAVFLEPTTMREVGRASLSEYMKDTASLLNDGAVFGADGSLYVIDRRQTKGEDIWNEYIGFERLTPPGAVQQHDTTLGRYTMNGQAADAPSENPDTTEEENNLPPVGENPNQPASDDYVAQAKAAAEQAKTAAQQAQQAAEQAHNDAGKLAELKELATKAEQQAAQAEEAAKHAAEQAKKAEAEAEQTAEALAQVKELAERARQARQAAEEAKTAAEKAQHAAEQAGATTTETPGEGTDKPKPGKPNKDWNQRIEAWLQSHGLGGPIAKFFALFAGILQFIIYPLIGLFGGSS